MTAQSLATTLETELKAFAALSVGSQLSALGDLAEVQGEDAFSIQSRKARIGRMIAIHWAARAPSNLDEQKATYKDVRDIIHRRFAIGYYRMSDDTATAETAVAALTAPTKNDAAKSADARATTAFGDCWKSSEVPNPVKRAPRASKANEDKTVETPTSEASQDDSGEDASLPNPGRNAPRNELADHMAALSIGDFLLAIGPAIAKLSHAPGKSSTIEDRACVASIAAALETWRADSAKDVTPAAPAVDPAIAAQLAEMEKANAALRAEIAAQDAKTEALYAAQIAAEEKANAPKGKRNAKAA